MNTAGRKSSQGGWGATALAAIWLGIPLFGKPLAFLSVFILFFARDKGGSRLVGLFVLVVISGVYFVYIGGRALVAGGDAGEALPDAFAVFALPLLVWWFVRNPAGLSAAFVFRATVVMVFVVFAASLTERLLAPDPRAKLLLSNPFNLAPLLLIPGVLISFDSLAPSTKWMWAGLAGIALTVCMMGAIMQTRSILLVCIVLFLIRLVLSMTEGPAILDRLLPTLRIICALAAGFLMAASDPTAQERFENAVVNLTDDTAVIDGENSVGLRMTMLTRGFEAYRERPVFGYGPQNRFHAVFPDAKGTHLDFSHLHNDFLTHAIAGGLPAIALFMLYLSVPAIRGWRREPGMSASTAGISRQFGLLASAALMGTAAVNNVLFVDISIFTTSFTLIWSIVFIDILKQEATVY